MTKAKGIKPEDILSDDQNFINLNGSATARKGSIAAFLKNIDLLETSKDEDEKTAALEMIKELAPVMVAVGLHKHTVFKNKEVQSIIDEEAKKNSTSGK